MRRTAGIVALVAVTTVVGAPAHAAGKPAQKITATAALVADVTARDGQAITTPAGDRFAHVVAGFPIGGHRTDLAVVTDRGLDQLRIYRIEAGGHLTDVTADDAPLLFSRDDGEAAAPPSTGYSLATYGRYAVVSLPNTTRLEIFRLEERAGKVTYRVTDTLDLPQEFRQPDGSTWSPREEPQVDGMVVDAEAGVLYAAQGDVAVWRIRLDGDQFAGAPRVVKYEPGFGAD